MKQKRNQQALLLTHGVLFFVLVLSILLRIPLLNGSFWLDEAAQALESSRPFWQQLDIAYDFQPPLLHLITHFALYISKAEWWLRLWGALIPGVISILATYQIGKKIGGIRLAFWSALLLTTSSFHIFYSQELRPYALPLMFGTLSWWYLLSWKKPQITPSGIAYALTTLAGLYSSYLYPFLLLGQVAFVLIQKRNLVIKYLQTSLIWILGFLPWIPFFIEQFKVGGQVRAELVGWENVVGNEATKSIALVFGKFVFGVLDLELTFQFAAVLLLVLLLTAAGIAIALTPHSLVMKFVPTFFKKQKVQLENQQQIMSKIMILFACWFVLPLITAWLISLKIPVLQPKRVLFLLPAFYLLLVAAAHSFLHKRVTFGFLGLLLLINIYGTSQYYLQPRLQRENWRTLQQEITHLYPKKSIAVFSFTEPFAPWQWYDKNQYPVSATGTLSITEAGVFQVFEDIEPYTYVLVFDYLRDLSDPSNQLLTALKESGYVEMDYFDQPQIGFVRMYGRPIGN